LVDDEEDVLELLSYHLRQEGFLVYIARDGEEAVRIAKEKHPAVTILDIMMPKLDGFEVCRQLRAFDSHMRIAFLSARKEAEYEEKAFKMGADAYIKKPITPFLFIRRVRALMKNL
jgi:two-component system alkaline phosphatase synthesis response regulator PhoP